MREIKFRAWDASGKSMIPAKSICRIHFSEGLPYCILKWDGNILIRGEVNLMQYTGLKDNSGKEIYEGDVVKSPLYGQTIGNVVFHKGAFIFGWETEDKALPNSCALVKVASSGEIIGNIYQNPELVEAK